MRSPILTTVLLFILLETLCSVTCRQGSQTSHNHNHKHRRNDGRSSWRRSGEDEDSPGAAHHHSNHIRRNSHHRPPPQSSRSHWSTEEESSEEGEQGRHAYVMNTDHLTSSPAPPQDEDKTLQDAFQKHMNPAPGFKAPHDIYAYKLPSELWFIVRYKKNAEGETDKYMNVVSSFTNYLDKLDTATKSVSVNVKGVETVFRLTSKP